MKQYVQQKVMVGRRRRRLTAQLERLCVAPQRGIIGVNVSYDPPDAATSGFLLTVNSPRRT